MGLKRVRLYGHEVSMGSFRTVSDGLAEALSAIDELAGIYPVDFELGEDESRPGAQATLALHAGAPHAVALSLAAGRHRYTTLMLAPNSDRIPRNMLEWIPKRLSFVLTPSAWGAEVLREQLKGRLPVYVVPHGVSAADTPPNTIGLQPAHEVPSEYRLMHLTSTNGERKGTRELLAAFARLTQPGNADYDYDFAQAAKLLVVVDPRGSLEVHEWIQTLKLSEERVRSIPNPRFPADQMVHFYRWASAVVQPSRTEGFGLVPLEALCAGVPAILTNCSGHTEYLHADGGYLLDGRVDIIEHGPETPIDDLEDASGPSVTTDAVAAALLRAFRRRVGMELLAQAGAGQLRKRWSWERSSGQPLKEILETL